MWTSSAPLSMRVMQGVGGCHLREVLYMKQKVKLKGHLKAYLQTTLILGILLIFVNVGVYFLDIMAGICVSGFLLVYLIAMLILLYRNRPVIMNEFINFATQYGQIQRTLLWDLALPHVLMDDDGRIIWMNAAFERVIHKEKGYRKPITTIFSSITKEKLEFEQDTEIEITFEEREYVFKMKRISIKDVMDNNEVIESAGNANFLIAGYLFDETALKRALRDQDEQSLAVGMIYIDNYDEARRSLLMALIDRKINKHIASIDGIARKTEKDKYLVIMRKKALMNLKESRFELLEDVKTVNIGNEMAVTVSIGVGVDAPTYVQNAEFARTAIDRWGAEAIRRWSNRPTRSSTTAERASRSRRIRA